MKYIKTKVAGEIAENDGYIVHGQRLVQNVYNGGKSQIQFYSILPFLLKCYFLIFIHYHASHAPSTCNLSILTQSIHLLVAAGVVLADGPHIPTQILGVIVLRDVRGGLTATV